MSSLATRLSCTEGQLYTAVIAFVLAATLFLAGVPPVLRGEPLLAAPPAVQVEPPTTSAVRTDTGDAPTDAPTVPPADIVGPPSPSRGPGAGTKPDEDARPVPAAPSPDSGSGEPGPTSDMPLSIIDSGYTSSTSGTPLSGPEVPDDGLPVGVRLGSVDKASFARLAGSSDILTLRLVDDPAANQLVALATVRACAITTADWSLDEPGAPPEKAPPHDDSTCVEATGRPDGTWRFDLSSLDGLNRRAGIALLPVSEGPTTFQVTFSTVTRPPG